jgi:hypothetical protein
MRSREVVSKAATDAPITGAFCGVVTAPEAVHVDCEGAEVGDSPVARLIRRAV